ncbi:metalloregulator ArsR/SmtB family transcription factor [Catenovulum adriaticum]|uniref:Metalloregulator ArsR/SmtB family transcription factor n=2 Tax=Catenovulum adriaticum TaxID=2984846 RepID=A0ABY7APT3_9ALTE|nr:metalloregulator ArsR/SmtB family transcription factor [Catenovulum sp. TS8]WAJ71564.1 metalloregulator ArsR/SmtB family transcription factor [Catenovulum sp. TS8]
MIDKNAFAQLEKNAEQAESLLKALSNKHRLMILCLLEEGELSVSQLNDQIRISQSSLSQNLAWLRREQYVKTRRDAQTIFYRLNDANVSKIIHVLHSIFCQPG